MPSLHRRTFLAGLGAGVGSGLAGCLDSPGAESSPEPTRTPTPTPRPECPAALARPAPAGPSGDVEPTPYPEPPAESTPERVARYVGEFERAYRRNEVVTNVRNLTDVGMGTPDADVETVETGFRATLRYTYYYNTDEYHADSPNVNVAYLVTDRLVYRVENEGPRTPEGGLDPESGSIVACRGEE